MTSAREQFGRTAQAYATSAVHARGADLDLLQRLIERRDAGALVDVGTGAGHTLVALAGRRPLLVGLDPTPEMLRAARGVLQERAVAASLVQGEADELPFADGRVDVITCRVAAHHFPKPREAFAEIARALAPGGVLYLVDNYAPDDPALDDFINSLERLRDPSHVRAYTLAEWQRLLADAGLRPSLRERWRMPLQIEDWLARSQTPPDQAAEARRRLRDANPSALDAFGISEREFNLLKALFVATKR